MNKRLFLKLLSLAGLGSLIPIPKLPANPYRQYLTSCSPDELIGLRFHWPESGFPNPTPGKDWVVCGWPLGGWIEYQGGWISNYRNNKAFTRPVDGSGPLKLICLIPVTRADGTFDYSRFELPPNTFYRE
jgi:hypothetical protein